MKNRYILLLSISLILCANAVAKLDIGAYLNLAEENIIYPTEAQLDMLRKELPNCAYQPAPSIDNRVFWDGIAASTSGKEWLAAANTNLCEAPEVPISDEIYRRANREGNRPIYKPRYYRTMERLESFMLAECLENEGRFLPQIEVYLNAIMSMKSWLHPNHDDDDNGVLEGRRVSIDLGARRFGSDLALAKTLLGDRLKAETRQKIDTQIRRRMIDTYLTSCRKNDLNNKWIKSTSNWNSVCTSGTLFSILAVSANPEERLAAVGCALNSMTHYLSGFGADGYCSEGLGYWGYGFGHYLYLAQVLNEYTQGSINLFEWNDSRKLARVGVFPEGIHIQNGAFPAFSDSKPYAKENGSAFQFASAMAAKHYGSKWPYRLEFTAAIEQLIHWTAPFPAASGEEIVYPGVTYFEDMGIVISRGTQEIPLSVAIKAGHNAENHNHSDVGSYTLVLGNEFPVADPSSPSYITGGFDRENDARSSWGHPVPYINKKRQSNGIEFRGEVVDAKFTDSLDRVVMNIRSAYEVAVLEKLNRTMENDKSGQGRITIVDEFAASEPIEFGTAMMTYSKYEIVDSNTVIFRTDSHAVKAEITAKGGACQIVVDPIKTPMGSGKIPQRIGINFVKPLTQGSVSVRYTPISE